MSLSSITKQKIGEHLKAVLKDKDIYSNGLQYQHSLTGSNVAAHVDTAAPRFRVALCDGDLPRGKPTWSRDVRRRTAAAPARYTPGYSAWPSAWAGS